VAETSASALLVSPSRSEVWPVSDRESLEEVTDRTWESMARCVVYVVSRHLHLVCGDARNTQVHVVDG